MRLFGVVTLIFTALWGCANHCPSCHATPVNPRPDNSTNLLIITQYNCPVGQWCSYWTGPQIWVNGNPLALDAACPEKTCQNGHGSIAELSVNEELAAIDVLGGKFPPRWIVDFEVKISSGSNPVFIWVADFGRKIEVVTKELACQGERPDFKRKFPIPDACNG